MYTIICEDCGQVFSYPRPRKRFCAGCIREHNRAYSRAYRAAHLDKVSAYNRAWFTANRERWNTYKSAWRRKKRARRYQIVAEKVREARGYE